MVLFKNFELRGSLVEGSIASLLEPLLGGKI